MMVKKVFLLQLFLLTYNLVNQRLYPIVVGFGVVGFMYLPYVLRRENS
jgi:hypothetical protein